MNFTWAPRGALTPAPGSSAVGTDRPWTLPRSRGKPRSRGHSGLRPLPIPRAPPTLKCGPGEYFDTVTGLCDRCAEICQPIKREFYDCKHLCPDYVTSKKPGGASSITPLMSDQLHIFPPRGQHHQFNIGHGGPHGNNTALHILPWCLLIVILSALLSFVTIKLCKVYRMRQRTTRWEDDSRLVQEITGATGVLDCSRGNGDSAHHLLEHTDQTDWPHNVEAGLPTEVSGTSPAGSQTLQEDTHLPGSPPEKSAVYCDENEERPPSLVDQETPSTLLSLHEDPDPDGAQTTDRAWPASLREASYHGSDIEFEMDMTVPSDLPKPEPGGRNISKILFMIDWVETFSSENGLWKILLHPRATFEKAKILIEQHTGLCSSNYQLGKLENWSFEPQGIGDEKDGRKSRDQGRGDEGGGGHVGTERRRQGGEATSGAVRRQGGVDEGTRSGGGWDEGGDCKRATNEHPTLKNTNSRHENSTSDRG